MMARTLAAAAHEVQGRLVGADQPFGVVTTDTRALGPGALFVAIPGDRFDGNDFIADAFAKKAAGALVSRLAASPLPQKEQWRQRPWMPSKSTRTATTNTPTA